jgi:hypothetical protein
MSVGNQQIGGVVCTAQRQWVALSAVSQRVLVSRCSDWHTLLLYNVRARPRGWGYGDPLVLRSPAVMPGLLQSCSTAVLLVVLRPSCG